MLTVVQAIFSPKLHCCHVLAAVFVISAFKVNTKSKCWKKLNLEGGQKKRINEN